MDIRLLLRRIALGLPLAVLPVGAGVLITSTGCLCGSCPPGESRMRTLSAEQLDSLANDTTNLTCNLLCEGTGDGGVAEDGAIGDAGLTSWRNWTCSLERETLRCHERVGCGVGRAPSGLVALDHVSAPSALAAHLAEMAHLERAAVSAFDDLAIELALHGAPLSITDRARRSAREEISHADIAGRLARARGAEVPAVQRRGHDVRSLVEIAEDNAFEGCVREAYGAIVASHQAAHAEDREIRTVLGAIARDEARHALLSLDLDAWARRSLTSAERRRVEERRRVGLDALASSLTEEPHSAVRRSAGLPTATVANELLAHLASAA